MLFLFYIFCAILDLIINIKYIDLRESSNALIILIYNENQLSNYIFKEENKILSIIEPN